MRLVVFGHNDWWTWERQGFRGRNAALVRAMARRPEVESIAVVDTPRFGARTSRPAAVGGQQVMQIEERIVAVRHAYLLPLPTSWRWARTVNDRSAGASLRRRLGSLGGDGPLVTWIADPRAVIPAARLPHDLLYFDAIDDWRFHAWAGRRAVFAGYEWAARHADLVTAVNPDLLDGLHPRGRAQVLFNAVAADEWQAPADETIRRRFKPPLIAYAGTLEHRFHVALACAVAREMPEATFLLAGPVLRGFLLPADAPANLVHLGALPASQVPGFLAASDAAMVPHRRDGIARSMDPLKIYEYLAAGKPVVSSLSSPNPALAGLVCVADDAAAFAAALRACLAADTPAARRRRVAAAAAESWDRRAEELVGLLSDELERRPDKRRLR